MALSTNNKIRPYANNSTNKYTDAVYDGLADRQTGAEQGSIASSAMFNTTLKQSTLITTAIAEYICQKLTSQEINQDTTVEDMATYIKQAVENTGAGGDMLISTYAPVASITSGKTDYVDKALNSDKLNNREANTFQTKTLYFTNVAVPTGLWVASTTYVDYPWQADITLSGITAGDYTYVVFNQNDISNFDFAKISSSVANNTVRIYASEQITQSLTLLTVKAEKVI